MTLNMAKVHHGKSIDEEIPLVSLHEFVWKNAHKHGDRIFLTNATTKTDCSFGDFLTSSGALSRGLSTLGLGKSDTMTCYGNNSIEYVVTLMAGFGAGLTVNTINPAATAYELRHYFEQVKPKVIFTEESFLENVEASVNILEKKPYILLRNQKRGYLDIAQLSTRSDAVINKRTCDVKNDVALILFSSGTTGLPKGVMLTHHNVVGHTLLRAKMENVPVGSTLLNIFPMYHAAGMFGGVFASVITGSRMVFMEKYNLEKLLECIQLYKPLSMFLPPPVIVQLAKTSLLVNYDVTSVKVCKTGAAPLKHQTEMIFRKRFNNLPVVNGYGMTETVAGVIWKSVTSTEDQKRPGTSGTPSLGVSLKVIDPSTGELLGAHQRGELCIQGPTVMKGYLNNAKATADTIDSEGWLHTGDVAYYDNDAYFYIVDRLKELIKYKGNQVAPAELEALLLEHDDVAGVGVVGVADPEAGEVPRAYVVRRDQSKLTEDDVMTYVNERVSHYKRLRGGVAFLSDIPKMSSGKILRRKLRELSNNQSKL